MVRTHVTNGANLCDIWCEGWEATDLLKLGNETGHCAGGLCSSWPGWLLSALHSAQAVELPCRCAPAHEGGEYLWGVRL